MTTKGVRLGNDPTWHRVSAADAGKTECGRPATAYPMALGPEEMVDCPSCLALLQPVLLPRPASGQVPERKADETPRLPSGQAPLSPAGFKGGQGRTADQVQKEGEISRLIVLICMIPLAAIVLYWLVTWLKGAFQ